MCSPTRIDGYSPEETDAIESTQGFIRDGITLGSRGLSADAIEAFEKAIAVCQTFETPSPAIQRQMASAMGNKGAALGDMGRHKQAVACYDVAISVYQRLVEQGGGDVAMVTSYAISVMNKGWALINMGLEKEGVECHEDALRLRRRLVVEGYEHVLPDVARSLYNIGEGYFKMGQYSKALPAFDEAVAISRELAADGSQAHEEDLAYELAAQADTLHRLGQLHQARDVSDEAIALLTRLARSVENPKLAGALATALDGRNMIEKKLKNKAPGNLD